MGACVGNIAGVSSSLHRRLSSRLPSTLQPFFYKTDQAPKYNLGIGSLLVANCVELALFIVFRYAFIWENKKKAKARENVVTSESERNATAFQDLTDKQNIKWVIQPTQRSC